MFIHTFGSKNKILKIFQASGDIPVPHVYAPLAGGFLARANARGERRPADRGPGAAVAQNRELPRAGGENRQAQLLLQSHQGLLLHAQRHGGEVPAREQGQTASTRKPNGRDEIA